MGEQDLELWIEDKSSEGRSKLPTRVVFSVDFESQPQQLEVEYPDIRVGVVEELLDHPVVVDQIFVEKLGVIARVGK